MVHTAAAADEQQLARLGFVPQVAERGTETAQKFYHAAKDAAPAPVAAQLSRAEEAVSGYVAPYVVKAQDVGSTLLKQADEKVDKALSEAGRVYQENTNFLQSQLEKQKQFHTTNLDAYRTARDQYLQKVEESVEFLKQNGLTGTARKAADEVLARVGRARELPGYLVHQVQEAWARLLALPPVRALSDRVQPLVDASLATYTSVHDLMVATPAYRSAFDTASALLARGESTWVWKSVGPYLQPTLNSVGETQAYKVALAQVQPKGPEAVQT